METINIIEIMRNYAISKDWHFVLTASRFFTNQELHFDNSDGKNIFVFDYKSTPLFESGIIQERSFQCLIMLGRKFDPVDGTSADINETVEQKHDRRLFDLTTELEDLVSSVSCDNGLQVSGANIEIELNAFDMNVDFVAMNAVNLIQK